MFETGRRYMRKSTGEYHTYRGYVRVEGLIGYYHVMEPDSGGAIAERTLARGDWMVADERPA